MIKDTRTIEEKIERLEKLGVKVKVGNSPSDFDEDSHIILGKVDIFNTHNKQKSHLKRIK